MAKRILVPVDGSAEALVPLVGALARGAGATVRLLRVMPEPELRVGAYGRVVAYVDQEMARLDAVGKEELEVVKSELAGIPAEAVVRFGDPATEIALEAEAFDADLIAVASPPRPLFRRMLSGDVSARLRRRVTLPVLVLHESAA
jgi:nucleotide-binding universal stress UspA family protein